MRRDVLDPLRSSPTPPPSLQARVIDAVRASGAFRPVGARWPWHMAAALLIFVLGAVAGRTWESAVPRPSDPQWMLLLGGDVTPAADGGTRAAEYGTWMRTLTAAGHRLNGAELADGSVLVAGQGGSAVGEPLARVGGYFILTAETEAEAVALARTCPHVRYGGTVVVRRLVR